MIDQPLPFTEALQFVALKVPQGAPWSSAEWALEHPAVRIKAFFSAHVEDARFVRALRMGEGKATSEDVEEPKILKWLWVRRASDSSREFRFYFRAALLL